MMTGRICDSAPSVMRRNGTRCLHSSFLKEWASRLQGPQSTSSTEAEALKWGRGPEATRRVKSALDARWLRPVSCDGHVDNDA